MTGLGVPTLRVLDLFAGACGGWSLGLHRAGYVTVAACEIDPWRRSQYSRNFPNVRMYEDVRDLTAERLRSDGVFPDIVVGSPPCQDASTANVKGRGIDGARTGLYLEAVRIVGECRPRWAAFENVPGIRNRGIDRVLSRLEQAGYACWPLVVGGSDIGAPHLRKRSWIVCADAATVRRLALPRDQSDRDSECVATDQPGDGWRQGRTRRSDPGPEGQQGELHASHDADTEEIERRSRSDLAFAEPETGAAGDADETGLEILGRQPGDDGAERAALERAIAARCGPVAENWNGGIAGRVRMATRLPKGMARHLLAAYGDTVIPKIPEMIGRAMSLNRAAVTRVGKKRAGRLLDGVEWSQFPAGAS